MSFIMDLKKSFSYGARDTLQAAQRDVPKVLHSAATTAQEVVQGVGDAVGGMIAFPAVTLQRIIGGAYTLNDNPIVRTAEVGNQMVFGTADLLTGHLLYSASTACGTQAYTPWFTPPAQNTRGWVRDFTTAAMIFATPAAKAKAYALLDIPAKVVPVSEGAVFKELAAITEQAEFAAAMARYQAQLHAELNAAAQSPRAFSAWMQGGEGVFGSQRGAIGVRPEVTSEAINDGIIELMRCAGDTHKVSGLLKAGTYDVLIDCVNYLVALAKYGQAGDQFTSVSIAAVDALARVGTLYELTNIAKGENVKPAVRVRAIEVLGENAGADLLSDLVKLEPIELGCVAVTAVRAIAKAGGMHYLSNLAGNGELQPAVMAEIERQLSEREGPVQGALECTPPPMEHSDILSILDQHAAMITKLNEMVDRLVEDNKKLVEGNRKIVQDNQINNQALASANYQIDVLREKISPSYWPANLRNDTRYTADDYLMDKAHVLVTGSSRRR